MKRLLPEATVCWKVFWQKSGPTRRIGLSRVPSHLRGGRILDIGCGSVPYFLLNAEFSHKFGVDKVTYGESQCTLCEERGIHFTDFDFEKESALPFDDQYFDTVTMLAVIEHMEPTRLPTMIAEVRRVLKTGGVCIVTTPAPWTDALLKMMAKLRLVSPVEINEHKATYGRPTMAAAFAAVGFEPAMICSGYFEMLMNVWMTAQR